MGLSLSQVRSVPGYAKKRPFQSGVSLQNLKNRLEHPLAVQILKSKNTQINFSCKKMEWSPRAISKFLTRSPPLSSTK